MSPSPYGRSRSPSRTPSRRGANNNNNRRQNQDVRYSNQSLDMLDDNGEKIITFTPSRFHNFDFTTVIEEQTDDPSYCFLCSCSQNDAEKEANDKLVGLYRYINSNLADVEPRVLAQEVQKYYNEELRESTDEKKAWRQEVIWNHIEKHAPTTKVISHVILRTFYDAFLVVRDNGLLLEDKATGQKKVDSDQIAIAIKLYGAAKMLIKDAGDGISNS